MNRREFLKSTSLLVGGLYLSGRAFGTIQPLDKGKLIKGRIRSSGKGIADTVISDGYNTTVTDKKGRYALASNKNAEYIFISTPAGYQIEHVDGFAAIYLSVTNRNYNFELKKNTFDDTNHFFLALGDPQIRVAEDANQLEEESILDITQYLQSTSKEKFHGISLGDSIWDNPKMWTKYQEAITKIGIPFFQVVGNHDKNEITKEESDANSLFKNYFGPTYYSFNRGQVHYIVLDNVRYKNIKEYDGHISDDQLNWLQKDLKYVPKDHVLIISAHIPIYSGIKNREELYALLTEFEQVHILSGHTHTNTNHVDQQIYEHTHASLCGAWWTGPVCADGTPRGYGVFEINGSKVTWHYKSIGRDHTYQFRSHVQQLNHGMNRITVNVWNYDPQWQVTWYADGVYMGALEQIKGYDELTLKLYKGEDLPADRRGWVEPKRTEHLFFTQSNAKTVKIVVMDRFGNNYEETLNIK
ncbi:metallophosphoesterase [Sphingobacterium alkalisoli]|uniref:Metallophosphoesterase n=1 Tax=Sphingobacterium alkalisoli TaxID=1874115 RepID=A0A4U0H5D0_9SPHI|nr:calcineurin-like phosphoesterase family protein [Sphingobacterium alkalisoli]TJY66910.1 metallophosphoesterase [Sphingobacterium alkalisoli]GGH13452.1 serine/threonine protein phosphatase [Sphingobacterium alkalisoli]